MKNEKGVTLITLVIMIVILLILASIGVNSGKNVIDSAKFNEFISELKIMQTKVNQLNQENKKEIGNDLTEPQKSILEIREVSDILYANKTPEQIVEIKSKFRFIDKQYIKENLEIKSIKRDYLVNIEKRIVISYEGLEYNGITYYMAEQLGSGTYNVEYNNKNVNNENNGNFELTSTVEGNKCKILVSNIQYNGYINNWQVKYQLEGESYWNTSNELSFYVAQEGKYNVKVLHGNEIDLGMKKIKVLRNGLIADKVNDNIIKVGDYVNYAPTSVSSTDTSFTDLVTELETYSGSAENTTSALLQENLNWRVLDVKDGKVRLISEVPTTSKVTLAGAKGYNNAVYLLDKTCKTLYSKTGYSEKVQSLKIEDIQDYLTYDYTQYENSEVDTGKYGGTKEYTTNRNYPNLFATEKTGWVDGTQGTQLDLSEQINPLDASSTTAGTSIKITQTSWYKSMATSDFTDSIYYNLFINNGSNYSTYWMSSRRVSAGSDSAYFDVPIVYSGEVSTRCLYNSYDTDGNHADALRPIITLNTKTQVDVSNIDNDGSVPEKAWELLVQ